MKLLYAGLLALFITQVLLADTAPIINVFKMNTGSSAAVLIGSGGKVNGVNPGTAGNILTSNGTRWVASAAAPGGVTSVNGQTGTVLLDTDDISEGSLNRYFSASQARSVLSGTSPLLYNSVSGDFSIQQSNSSQSGYLSSSDWTTFNNKQPAGSYASQALTINTTSPLLGGGNLSTDRTFSIQPATNLQDGYFTAASAAVYNAKQDFISPGTASQYYRGDKAFADLYGEVRTAFSATAPMTYNNSTGLFATPNFTAGSAAVGTAGLVPAPSINQGYTDKYLNASGAFTSPGFKVEPEEASRAVSTWTGRTAAAANQWFGAAWAPELHLFCAISSSGTNRVQWSRDGITWTSASATAASVWTKIAWSPELRMFAAVAFDGTTSTNLMTSPDCRTWTARTSVEANQWYDIKWAPALGKFLAVSINGTNRCQSSTDGITWTACTMAAAIQWYSVTWSPELRLFAAVSITASGSNYAATSPDGVTWTMRALTTGNTWYSVTWAPEIGLFVAVGATGTSRAATSPDGITWTLRSIQSQAWRRVVWAPQLRLLIAVSSGGNISTSPDGITWTARTSPEANQWYEIVWSPELNKAVVFGITGTSRVLNSRDISFTMGNKLANFSTPSNLAEQIVRRDQNGAFIMGALTASSATFQGAIAASSATINGVEAASSALIGGASAATNATLINANGHIKIAQTVAPTTAVHANAGAGATCNVTNATDTAGRVSIATGTGLGSGEYCSVIFNKVHNTAPVCLLFPNTLTISSSAFVTVTTASMAVNFGSAAETSTYGLNYQCLETQ